MKILIIGTGRMGRRHAKGALEHPLVKELIICDVNPTALAEAYDYLATIQREDQVIRTIDYNKLLSESDETFPTVIVATTAGARVELVKEIARKGCMRLLVEKPVAQSLEDLDVLIEELADIPHLQIEINHPFRLDSAYMQLKTDFQTIPQLSGPYNVSLNAGSVGIGCNGIHYIDLMFYLFDADFAEIVYADIENELLDSGRGPQFKDFGGNCMLKLYNKQGYIGKVFFSISANSTAYGGWDYIAKHGRVVVDELQQFKCTHIRHEDSSLPMYRYAGDYKEPVRTAFVVDELSDCTNRWITTVSQQTRSLPNLQEARKVHQIMFEWLNHSNQFKHYFPIT